MMHSNPAINEIGELATIHWSQAIVIHEALRSQVQEIQTREVPLKRIRRGKSVNVKIAPSAVTIEVQSDITNHLTYDL